MKKENNSDSQYIPNNCNIGSGEVKVRKLWLEASVLAVIAFTYFSIKHENNYWIKACLFISFSALVVLYMQVRQKFCVTFGLLEYFNFSKTGKAIKVTDKKALLQDRKKVLKIICGACLAGLIYTFLIDIL